MKHFAVLLMGSVFILSACSGVKETLGMERSAPDEFAVVERAPLTVPPSFDLVAPQPGAKRPQDNTTNTAKGLVLGSQSSAPKVTSGSRAEQSLLNKVGANTADPTIRQQLAGPDESPAPKTVAEKLGMTGDDQRGKVLDPVTEAKRLDASKVKTVPVKEKPKVADAK